MNEDNIVELRTEYRKRLVNLIEDLSLLEEYDEDKIDKSVDAYFAISYFNENMAILHVNT